MRSSDPGAEPRRRTDPWAVGPTEPSDPARRSGTVRTAARVALVAAFAASGPVARLATQGLDQHRASIGVLVACATVIAVAAAVATTTPARWWWVVAGLGAALAHVATRPQIGRAPSIVLVVGLVAAHTSFGPRRPTGAASERPLLAVALLTALEVTWARSGSNTLAALLGATAIGAAALGRLRPDATARANAAVRWLGTGLGVTVGRAAVLIVTLPTLYLGGGLSRIARAVRARLVPASTTRWRHRDVTVEDQRRDARAPYASTPRRTRARRHVAGIAAIVTVVAAGLIARAAVSPEPPPIARSSRASTPTVPPDFFERLDRFPYSKRPGLASMPFADELQEELLTIPLVADPVTLWGVGDGEGRYVNVDEGRRRTIAPPCDCPRMDLWLLGGSQAFGIAQRDEHTVASELVRLAAADGVALVVENLGVPGWTIWQEGQRFQRRLQDDPQARPDVAVFLDGFNDALGIVTQALAAGEVGTGPTVMNSDDVFTMTERRLDVSTLGGGAALGAEAARRYLVEQRAIDDAATAVGTATEYFLQPDAFASPRQREFVDDMYALDPELFERAEAARSLDGLARHLEGHVTDLRDLFASETEPVFGDVVHTNELGARRIAEAIYDVIRPRVVDTAARG